jgi:hypothetical protein
MAKHGYPSGTAHRILSERDKAKHPDRMRRYMQTYRDNANCRCAEEAMAARFSSTSRCMRTIPTD